MPRTIDDLMKSWPASRRAKVDARAKDLAAEYRTLQDLRKAQDLTQERIAEILGIKQANVSRLEKRSDLLLSTLRSYVAAMGGDLELVARFPDRPPVILSGLRNMEKASPAGRPRRAQAAHGSRKPARRPSAASH